MTISYRQGTGHPTTTLVTFNRYVDNVTGASKIERWLEPPGKAPGGSGDPVLYWKEDMKLFKKRKPKHAINRRRGFFLRALFTPRKPRPFYERFKLFGVWR